MKIWITEICNLFLERFDDHDIFQDKFLLYDANINL